jgi:hypothetical protein
MVNRGETDGASYALWLSKTIGLVLSERVLAPSFEVPMLLVSRDAMRRDHRLDSRLSTVLDPGRHVPHLQRSGGVPDQQLISSTAMSKTLPTAL